MEARRRPGPAKTAIYKGIRIGDVLDQRGLKRRWVAEQLGISSVYLSQIVNGHRGATPELARGLSNLLQLPLSALFEFDEQDILSEEPSQAA